MILYIPTAHAEELYNLLDNFAPLHDRYGDPYKDAWVTDLMYQIRENGPKRREKRKGTVNLREVIEREVKRILEEKGIKL